MWPEMPSSSHPPNVSAPSGAKPEGTAAPQVPPVEAADSRVRGAWHAWLSSLATDAEAATAAAHLYAELPAEARDAWLDALAEDAPKLDVPGVAVYGPLLAVESDPSRCERIRRASKATIGPLTEVRRALLGTAPGGVRITVLVIPLYLSFVRVLVCRIVKDRGFEWAKQDPIVCDADAPVAGTRLQGVELFATSQRAVIDELAHAVLANRRKGLELPPLMRAWADVFSARLISESELVCEPGLA